MHKILYTLGILVILSTYIQASSRKQNLFEKEDQTPSVTGTPSHVILRAPKTDLDEMTCEELLKCFKRYPGLVEFIKGSFSNLSDEEGDGLYIENLELRKALDEFEKNQL